MGNNGPFSPLNLPVITQQIDPGFKIFDLSFICFRLVSIFLNLAKKLNANFYATIGKKIRW